MLTVKYVAIFYATCEQEWGSQTMDSQTPKLLLWRIVDFQEDRLGEQYPKIHEFGDHESLGYIMTHTTFLLAVPAA